MEVVLKRSGEQILEQLDAANETLESSKFFGMSYEEGVKDAIEWMIGHNDHPPMENYDN